MTDTFEVADAWRITIALFGVRCLKGNDLGDPDCTCPPCLSVGPHIIDV